MSSTDVVIMTDEFEIIAQAMLATRGDLAKASRFDAVGMNAMALRNCVKDNPPIRRRYHELLADEMQEKGLHIAERILKMAELQDRAFGGEYIVMEFDTDAGKEVEVVRNYPVDPKSAIDLSKEISRLISEGKGQNMSAHAAVLISSKEDAKELLEDFLNS